MEEVIFFEYPDKAYIGCQGVYSTTDKTGQVWGYQSCNSKPIRKRHFNALCKEIEKLDLDLPERFGLILQNYIHKGLQIKPSGIVSVKLVSPLAASTEAISFQFKKNCVSSFTKAIENAERIKNLIFDYQLANRAMREAMHESVSHSISES